MHKYNFGKHIKKTADKPLSKPKMKTVGTILKKEREHNSKTIEQVSNETKIGIAKLHAIESDDYSVFDSRVHASGFIKIYTDYLGLDADKILALYRRDYKDTKSPQKAKTPSVKENKTLSPWRYLILGLPLLAILLVFVYLYIQYYNFHNPPVLEIIEPKDNIVVEEDEIALRGRTEPNTIIEINDETVSVDDNYDFEKNIGLQPGSNIITVRATNVRNPSREAVKILSIEYEESVEEGSIENEGEKQTLILKIENSPTWVEIIEDDQLIISEILPEGYEETFQPEKNISISTSIIPNTIVNIDGEHQIFSASQYTLSCEVKDSEIDCA